VIDRKRTSKNKNKRRVKSEKKKLQEWKICVSQVQASQSGVFLNPKDQDSLACYNQSPYLVLIRRSYGIILLDHRVYCKPVLILMMLPCKSGTPDE
jgi:hypothetical protein